MISEKQFSLKLSSHTHPVALEKGFKRASFAYDSRRKKLIIFLQTFFRMKIINSLIKFTLTANLVGNFDAIYKNPNREKNRKTFSCL